MSRTLDKLRTKPCPLTGIFPFGAAWHARCPVSVFAQLRVAVWHEVHRYWGLVVLPLATRCAAGHCQILDASLSPRPRTSLQACGGSAQRCSPLCLHAFSCQDFAVRLSLTAMVSCVHWHCQVGSWACVNPATFTDEDDYAHHAGSPEDHCHSPACWVLGESSLELEATQPGH